MLPLLLLLIATFQLAAATPYKNGYSYGCNDGKVGYHSTSIQCGKGIDFHTTDFMRGYDAGYKTCFSPNGSDGVNRSRIHSQSSDSDIGGTILSCNKSEHTIEFCNGYRAAPIRLMYNDNPDKNITPSKVKCQGGSPGSESDSGYQQGYADEDHAMLSSAH